MIQVYTNELPDNCCACKFGEERREWDYPISCSIGGKSNKDCEPKKCPLITWRNLEGATKDGSVIIVRPINKKDILLLVSWKDGGFRTIMGFDLLPATIEYEWIPLPLSEK